MHSMLPCDDILAKNMFPLSEINCKVDIASEEVYENV
jgi:hypothetical protein